MKKITDSDQNASAAVLKVTEVKGDFSKGAQKRNKFQRRLKGMEVESGRRLTRLSTMLVNQARMDRMLRGVTDHLVCVLTASLMGFIVTWQTRFVFV